MKAVIYARYSSDNQREESIEGQIRECTEYAKYNDLEVVGHYIDRAYSAKTDKRPDFQRMIKDSAKKNFQLVIVWKLDRFARNRYDSAIYKAALKKNGVRVISVTEHITDDATGGLMESIFEGDIVTFFQGIELFLGQIDADNTVKVPLFFGVSTDRRKQNGYKAGLQKKMLKMAEQIKDMGIVADTVCIIVESDPDIIENACRS